MIGLFITKFATCIGGAINILINKFGSKKVIATNWREVATKKVHNAYVVTFQADIEELGKKDVLIETTFPSEAEIVEYDKDMKLTVYWKEKKQKVFNYSESAFQVRNNLGSGIVGGVIILFIVLSIIISNVL